MAARSYVGDAVHITGATSSDRERGPTSMKLNIDDLARIKLLRLAGTNFGICGAWHLHPRVGAWRASDADFAAWESMYEYVNEVEGRWEPAIAAIVAVPEDDGSLAHPQLAAWTTTKQDGRLVTEPSRIVQRPDSPVDATSSATGAIVQAIGALQRAAGRLAELDRVDEAHRCDIAARAARPFPRRAPAHLRPRRARPAGDGHRKTART